MIDSTHPELLTLIGLPGGRTVLLSVVQAAESDVDREEWLALSAEGLARAYGEAEPEYTAAMVKTPNPEYRPW